VLPRRRAANRRIALAYLTGCLAILAVWLLVTGIAQAADPPRSPRHADSSLSMPGAVSTPTLRLSGPGGETLVAPSAHRMLVSDPSISLYVYNPLTSEVSVTAQLVTLRSAAGQPLPATLGLSPASRAIVSKEVGTWTLSLIDGWLPAGPYTGTLRLTGAGTKPVSPEFVLLVSPWAAELEWAEKGFAHMVDTGHSETTVRVTARLGHAEDIRLELPTLAASDAMTKPFSTNDFLKVAPTSRPMLKQDTTAAFTLTFTADRLPQPGIYRGELWLSASNAAAITAPFELVISDRAPVTPWPAELEWAQEEFVYVADEKHSKDTFWVTARVTDVQGVQAAVTTLRPRDGITAFIATDFLATPALPPTLTKDSAVSLTLAFTASAQPVPGTYDGTLQVSGSNAEPITTPFTLVIPDRARGSYQLSVAELGKTVPVTPTGLTLMTALQFTGMRWLPGSTSLMGSWWPTGAGALLLGTALAALAWYTVWALAEIPQRADDRSEREGDVEETERSTKHTERKLVAAIVVFVLAAGAVVVLSLVLRNDITQAHVGERTLLVWEANGRGPVRDIIVEGGQVANDAGDTGRIYIDRDGELVGRDVLTEGIEAGQVLTKPFTVQGMSQPGVYQGRILIQSPDIAVGVHEVPVQVTVHDFIVWPVLVILVGVVVGGYTKYQQEITSQRLKMQRAIEQTWQKWDDYLLRDKYRYRTPVELGQINPIYDDVRRDLDYAVVLLRRDSEWGIEDADRIVSDVEEQLTTYQWLAEAVANWVDESGREPEAGDLKKRIEAVENALRQGDLHLATDLMGRLVKEAMPARIEQLRKLVKDKEKTIGKEKAEKIQALLDAASKLWKEEKYGAAWLNVKEAEYEIRALGAWDASQQPTPIVDEHVIQVRLGRGRLCVRDTILLKVVSRGEDLPKDEALTWNAVLDPGADSVDCKFTPGNTGRRTAVEFFKEGDWTVTVERNGSALAQRVLSVEPSGMEVVYRDKRRYSYRRRLAAAAVAVAFGMAAKRVFDLNFGSFEQYLGAFIWGAGVSAGIDPTADAYARIRDWLSATLFKLKSEAERKGTQEGGQPASPAGGGAGSTA
jgi:hypothetical protein